MKLRFGSTFRDLAYRFNVNERTISKYFFHEIRYLYFILKPLIVWPSRESLRETTPISFRKTYESRVVSIFDCFEIFCEKPAGLDTSAMMYSFYKHHHTIKVLLCKFFLYIQNFFFNYTQNHNRTECNLTSCGIF